MGNACTAGRWRAGAQTRACLRQGGYQGELAIAMTAIMSTKSPRPERYLPARRNAACRRSPRSASDQYQRGGRRSSTDLSEVDCRGRSQSHLAFSTEPWRTVEDFKTPAASLARGGVGHSTCMADSPACRRRSSPRTAAFEAISRLAGGISRRCILSGRRTSPRTRRSIRDHCGFWRLERWQSG